MGVQPANEELTWTDGVFDLFELPRGSPVTRAQILELYYEDSRREMERLRRKAIRERGGFTLDIRIRTAKGNDRWLRLTGDVECEGEATTRIFGLKQDITDERELWEQMRLRAERDPLTGLANRGVFQSWLLGSPASRRRSDPLAALVIVDVDGFKQINDTFGHTAGDECLKQIADRLRRIFPPEHLVARIGGDEFAILLRGARSRARIEEDVRRILGEMRNPVRSRAQSFAVGASIGVALPGRAKAYDASQLFAEADLALYAAKKAGRNTFRTFGPDLDSEPRSPRELRPRSNHARG